MGNSTQKEKEKVKLPEGSRVMPREQQKRIQQATQERRERNTYASTKPFQKNVREKITFLLSESCDSRG